MADNFSTQPALAQPAALAQRPVRVLAVGATGRLGRLLVPAWRSSAFGLTSGLELALQARSEGKGADILFDPLADSVDFRRAAEAADVVLCLAGVTPGQDVEMGLNVTLAQAACEAGKTTERPVILASSAAVYGRGSADLPLAEDGPLAPLSDYGRAKVAMEEMARGYARTCCLRIGNVAGADALLGAEAPAAGRVLDMFGGMADKPHGPLRSYIGPVTLAQALARLARFLAAGARVPEILNMAEPDLVSMDALLRAAGEPFTPRPAPTEAIERVELDVSRAVALGLVPERPVEATRLVAELRQLRGDLR
ncbi:NAD(P)-dependent oxidoreductase [Thioclava sp. 'Guangxiensis']|uniref:NAD-dependent epimerase/dehydratase family protein n=1 Tax=Thioclava sp. 'Guangxiensis' TaxID=3149044 RepID=UPI00387840FD